MAGSAKPTYQSYLKSFKAVLQSKNFPNFLVVAGSSDALNTRTLTVLINRLKKQNITVTSFDADQITAAKLHELTAQRSLFEPKSAYLLRRTDKAKQFPKQLAEFAADDFASSHIILSGDAYPQALDKEVQRLKGASIISADPWPSEMSDVIYGLAQEKGLSLDRSAVALLQDAIGNDIAKLDNELTKIVLIHGKDAPVLKADDISHDLGFLREDHAFRLDQYLLAKDQARATALCFDLLNRGEQGIQILWILTNHFRKAIAASDLVRSGATLRDLAFKLRLPQPVAKSYQAYVGTKDKRRFMAGLNACQEADARLKTSSMDEFLILSSVIAAASRA